MRHPPVAETDLLASDRIRAILADLLHFESADSVAPSASLRKDLDVDSLGMVDLVTLLEEGISIRFTTCTDLSEIHARVLTETTALDEPAALVNAFSFGSHNISLALDRA